MLAALQRHIAAACSLLALICMASPTVAEDFPEKPITLIMPFGTGNAPDTLARIIGEYLQTKHGVTLLITSKAGGSGIPAMVELSRARPDGYTISLTSANILTVVPQVKPCGFTWESFTHIAQVSEFTMGWGVLPASGITSLVDLMGKAKAAPDKYSLGSPGALTAQRFFHMQLMKHFPGSNVPYVAYNGGGELITALLGGHISVAYTPIANFLPHKNNIRVIAVSSAKRDPYYPDVPTFAELVSKNLIFDSVYGIVGPKLIPAERVERLQALFREALADPGVQAKLKQVYIRPNFLPGVEFSDVLKQYNDFFTEPIRQHKEENTVK
ncbi:MULTISPECIES: tripartite tricarboxylate transporter substrate binding protein [unclassified Desulfovibrio]|uniref:Bug family tripartite tricarboxylate transporter substrate binding protein n=1 Tax=unclassified Desulfovibrio TaxID=2593640 RepID=UPI000F5FAB49|nr:MULTISPECIES: tripartite tricarboxylate transporter substrate binding protein [unclassified Desulfovibrio]RRD70701.1 tripartite tricarboxylate transporter substrate binding protein [Desulfovibrio sp. OH1209_COT-279]RRD87103.1 tripartite tricarboxylate transporter substrate binding protein [Desulfovibrio sp. OH1186_COT-070]